MVTRARPDAITDTHARTREVKAIICAFATQRISPVIENLLFLSKKLLSVAVLPPGSTLVLWFAGLFLLHKRPRTAGLLLWTGSLLLLALSLPAVSNRLELSIPSAGEFSEAAWKTGQAVVILGGGLYSGLADDAGASVNAYTLERVRHGARVARLTRLPIAVSGGVVWGGPSEASLMSLALREYGLTPRWEEERSRDTHDNAVFTARILLPQGVRRIVLVTHAFHMARSADEFRAAGFEVLPAPALRRAPGEDAPGDFLPSVTALRQSSTALHEHLGRMASGARRSLFPAAPTAMPQPDP